MFERPRLRGDLPAGLLLQRGLCAFEVRREVRAEIQAGVLPHPRAQLIQKRRLENTVFVVTQLGPWVGEQNVNRRNCNGTGNCFEEKAGVSLDEMEALKSCPIPLTKRSCDTVARDVDPNTDLVGMGLGVSSEEVPMAAADFPHK